MNIYTEVGNIKGVGPKMAERLNKVGIFSIFDLLLYFPRDYEDRSKTKNIADLVNGEEVTIQATVVSEVTINRIRKNMTIIKATVEDNTGRCTITWFNQTYIKQHIKRGETYKFFGKAINEFNIILSFSG